MRKVIPFPKPFPLERYGYQYEYKIEQDFDTLNKHVYEVNMIIEKAIKADRLRFYHYSPFTPRVVK